jgi:hypothetical protein
MKLTKRLSVLESGIFLAVYYGAYGYSDIHEYIIYILLYILNIYYIYYINIYYNIYNTIIITTKETTPFVANYRQTTY